MSACRACGKPILWIQKPDGRYHRPLDVISETPGYTLIDGELRDAPIFLRVHGCDPQLIAELEFRRVSYDAAVRSVDCPHPRCNGVQGGPCISLVDGETELRSYHPQRVRAVPRERLPKAYGGEL